MIRITSGRPWNYKCLGRALVVSVILQTLLLPCLCDIGQAKVCFALVVDAAIVIRTVAANLLKETGSGWKFYAGLLYASPLWISMLALMVLGDV